MGGNFFLKASGRPLGWRPRKRFVVWQCCAWVELIHAAWGDRFPSGPPSPLAERPIPVFRLNEAPFPEGPGRAACEELPRSPVGQAFFTQTGFIRWTGTHGCRVEQKVPQWLSLFSRGVHASRAAHSLGRNPRLEMLRGGYRGKLHKRCVAKPRSSLGLEVFSVALSKRFPRGSIHVPRISPFTACC